MPSFTLLIDLPLIVFAYTATLLTILHWVYRTDQDDVPKSNETAMLAAFRLTIVTSLIAGFCYLAGIAFWFLVVIAAVLALTTWAGGWFGIAGLPVIGLVFLTKEYVLGFPELVLSPKEQVPETSAKSSPHVMIGRTTTLTSPLRPQGKIVVEGKSFSAASDDGTMMDAGIDVVVTGSRNGSLLVAETQRG